MRRSCSLYLLALLLSALSALHAKPGPYSNRQQACSCFVVLNVHRLGWSRFLIIQTIKKLFGGPAAMAIAAPSGWSKLHDEMKIYAGYFRFLTVLALVIARGTWAIL